MACGVGRRCWEIRLIFWLILRQRSRYGISEGIVFYSSLEVRYQLAVAGGYINYPDS